ncbi:Gfo/Idh/MocA family protein [Paenibacillus eucommiae]|uniref:Dehydrogenase n=1 Tax=Paenibacillus eucommiae TaxID=1355755 RepID=A0ABS4J779_9BACL|nr:Gfo/Idh/MocA family oxidoreductase [Paenibacillus eucommiae]MBP1995668.1 putative dehydrogenase [Paenibacillus eucommiae]
MNTTKLRWGILGCAAIAEGSVIPGIQASETGIVQAIASRELDKAEETAAQFGIPVTYGSYEELLADSEIEAVYIPLPNHLHKEWTLKAAEAGKHVLCEKPLALDAAEALEMVQACEAAGVHLAEAFMYRHHPRYEIMKEVMRSGEIGEVRSIHGTYTYNHADENDNVRFHRHMGGGSIYDVGCYPISAARFLLDQEPHAATVKAFFSPDHDHVDMMATGLLEFPDDVAVTFDCAMWASPRNTLEILGTLGRIQAHSAFVSRPNPSCHFFIVKDEELREVVVPYENPYSLQADNLANAIWGVRPLRFEPLDAVKNMRVIDACLKSAGTSQRVEL